MICMHFDCPDLAGLSLLQEIKLKSPSIPITMFTVQHSEELAIWAMRSRVWEYVVLPLSAAEINRYLNALEQLCTVRSAARNSKALPIEHGPALPDSIRLTTDRKSTTHCTMCCSTSISITAKALTRKTGQALRDDYLSL